MNVGGAVDMFRCIPADRLKAFIERYIAANYELEDHNRGITQFSFDSGIPARRIYAILEQENANFSFSLVDRMLTRLDCVHVWHLSEEEGGFRDYYENDIPPAPATPTPEQLRLNADRSAKRSVRKRILREQAA